MTHVPVVEPIGKLQNAASHTRMPVAPVQGSWATQSELELHDIGVVALSTNGEEGEGEAVTMLVRATRRNVLETFIESQYIG